MTLQILFFLLQVLATLIGGAALLRFHMNWQGVSLTDPLGRLVLALTDWLVRPLRMALPKSARIDTASLLAAWLIKLAHYALLMLLAGRGNAVILPVLALLGVGRLAVSVGMALVIFAAILSWTQSHSMAADALHRLAAPILAPVRRLIRPIGGVDLSPLLVVVLLQVLGMVLANAQTQLAGRWLLAGAGL
ncbi:MAG: YggT family protein [Burkholderiaceae bacterium]|jgi:YggT family protein|nr:YggT family protein [Burkholderiaceae bacterium]